VKQTRFAEQQNVGILKATEGVVLVKDLCRKQRVSDATSYNWKAGYAGLVVTESKRSRGLEAETVLWKKMYAGLAVTNEASRTVLNRKP